MPKKIVSGAVFIVEEEDNISLMKLCRCCALSAESIISMVELGIIDTVDASQNHSDWQFPRTSLLRVQTTLRLQKDLEVNLAGAVLALELMDEIKQLREKLAYFQH